MPISFFFFFLLLLCLSCAPLCLSFPTHTHSRRILHQPFFPSDSVPPTQPPSPQPPAPKFPFSTSNQPPFFPTFPSPPSPPSPPLQSSPSAPANASSLNLPKTPKPKPTSKLVPVAIALVVSAVVVAAIAIFLCFRKSRSRRGSFHDHKTYTPENSNRVFQSSAGNPDSVSHKPRRSPPPARSSEFLYLGTVVNSRDGVVDHAAPNSGRHAPGRKLDSPELRPLPPLSGQQQLRQNFGNCSVGYGGGEEEDEEFYSPRASSVGRDSSIATGSASRRVFANVSVQNFDRRSSTSSYSSSSDSPSRSASMSISLSPPVSLSPKSPDLIAVQVSVPPPPPPISTLFPNKKKSRSPSPSSSPETPLMKTHGLSPRISDASDQYLDSPVRISTGTGNPVAVCIPPPPPPPIMTQFTSNKNSISSSHSSSPETPLMKIHGLSPRRSLDSPVRVSNGAGKPVAVFIPPPPPPPLPPPPRNWESPVSTPSIRNPISKPPLIIAPSRPVANHSPSSISPMGLPPSSEALEKTDGTPKPKLKPLHWDKVRASSDREMVWDQLRSSSFKLNEEMFETLFTAKAPISNPNEPTRRPVLPSPRTETRVLDPKKSQNIAISLRALNVTIEEVCDALLEGNAETLGTELLECLLKMAPTKEEERKLKEFKDDSPFKLGPAEKFLKAVLDIPFAFKRVNAMLYIANFDSEVEYLKKTFETLEAACEELRNSRMFLKLLEAVLKTGNRMNVGTNRGDAHAFKLDTLLKLVDVKGADGKTTLLHFVVQEIIRSEGARFSDTNQTLKSSSNDDAKCRKLGLQVVSGLGSELVNVKKVAAMDSNVLSGDAKKLSKGIANIREVIQLNKGIESDDDSSWKFSESMNKFIEMAEDEIIRIQAQESVAISLVKEITEYFHGNSSKEEAHPFRIFMVVRDFLANLDRVCKEVATINERTIVSSAHKFPVPVNPNLQPAFALNEFPGRRHSSSSDEDSSSS